MGLYFLLLKFINDTTFHFPTSIWCTFEKFTKYSGKRHVRLVPDHLNWPLIWKLSGDLRKPDTYVVIRVLSVRPCKLTFGLEAIWGPQVAIRVLSVRPCKLTFELEAFWGPQEPWHMCCYTGTFCSTILTDLWFGSYLGTSGTRAGFQG